MGQLSMISVSMKLVFFKNHFKLISVIIPTYNRCELIGDTINSMLRQTYEDFELIIVDDHSTDNTLGVVEELMLSDHRITYYKRPENLIKGGNSCRNFGLSLAKGEYIKWLDSDDLLYPSALLDQVESLENTDFDLSICESVVFNDPVTKEPIANWGNIREDVTVSNFISAQFRWHTASGLWRRSFFQKTDIWKEGLTNSQEWLMHLTQLINQIKIVKVEKTLCLIRAHSGSMSNKINKSGDYYFNECYARFLAIGSLKANNALLSAQAKQKIIKQFFIYQFFTLYKGSINGFLYSFKFYPSIVFFILK
jgi:glycosyltransferase involved in cell wall biosynthesis